MEERTQTTYDVETLDDVPPEVFLFRPGDTVKVEFGPKNRAGFMVVQEIVQQSDTPFTRIRGIGVESFIGSPSNPPLATIKADRWKRLSS